jgi:hypothetical protein
MKSLLAALLGSTLITARDRAPAGHRGCCKTLFELVLSHFFAKELAQPNCNGTTPTCGNDNCCNIQYAHS